MIRQQAAGHTGRRPEGRTGAKTGRHGNMGEEPADSRIGEKYGISENAQI